MKPEPLKGKHFSIDDRFKREDIRSAVRFAIEEIKKRKDTLTYTEAIIILSMAFEDVMK